MKTGKDILEIEHKCPFCSGEARLCVKANRWTWSNAVAYVRCTKCGARGPRFESDYVTDQLKLDAVDGWNFADVFQ